MISFNKKSGFSLAESVISLMIMSLVILLTFAAITRKRTVPVNKTTISGVYACWKESGTLKESYYDGHSLVGWIDSNGERKGKLVSPQSSEYNCRFPMDRRAYKYYVVAVGSRGESSSSTPNYVDGQFQQVMFPTPTGAPGDDMFLYIKLGDVNGGNGGVTSVLHGDDKVVEAIGGVKANTSQLVGGNIKSCKWISKNPCTPVKEYTVTCEVRETTSDILARVGKNPYKTNLVLTCKNKSTGKVDNRKSCEIEIDSLKYTTGGVYKGSCTKGSGTLVDNIEIKVEEKDSSYKAEVTDDTKESQFVHYLKMIPQNIQNGLTDDLLKYYQKNSNKKNGVVLIIW